jgi:hypothetical protein
MAEAADQPNNSAVKTRAICRELFAFTPIKIVVNLVGTRPLLSYLIVPMMWSHLSIHHLSREGLSEYSLILARSGRFDVMDKDVSNWWVCPRHRHSLGKFWLPAKRSCNMPNHTCAVKTLTGRDVATCELAKWAQKLYGLNVQLGAGMSFVMETIKTR